MSPNHLASRVVLGLCLLTPSIAQAPPTSTPAIEDMLPASSYACLRFGGLSACGAAAESTPLAAILRDLLAKVPAQVRQQHFDAHLEQAANELQRGLQRVGVSAADLRAVLGRPMVLAVGRPTIEGMGPSVALVADLGGAGDAARRVLAALEAVAAHEGRGRVTFADAQVDGATMRAMAIEEGPTVLAGEFSGCFVVTNSRAYLRDMAAVKAGKVPSLRRSSDLGGASGRLQAPALASVFVNTAPLMGVLDPLLPYEAADYGRALGVSTLDSLYAGVAGVADGGTEVLHIGLHGDEKGLCKALVSAPADLGFAARCSKNTVAFLAGSFDVPGVVDAFGRFADLLPEQARVALRHELPRELARELRRLGTTPEAADALLRALGGQIGIAFGFEPAALPKPELLMSLSVRDWQQVTPLLQRLEAAVVQHVGCEWKVRKSGERTIRYFELPLAEAKLQLSPCYVQTDDALLVASDVAALLRALGQHKKPEDSLAAQEDFVAAGRRCAGASGLLHLRLFRAVDLGWRAVETYGYPGLDANREQQGFGSEVLPDAETIARAAGTMTFAVHVDSDAIVLQSHGSMGLGALLAGLGRGVDEVLARASSRIF